MQDNTDLIADLRLNHEYCPKEVILQAADALEAMRVEIEVQTKAADHWISEANKSHNLTVTQQVEIDRLTGLAGGYANENLRLMAEIDRLQTTVKHLSDAAANATFAEKAALARLAELEKQEPVGYVFAGHGLDYIGCVISGTPSEDYVPLYAAPAVQPSQARCQYCDGTGDVHGIDGEWRGSCTACKPAQPSQAPEGFALVPIRATRAMEEVFEEEGWEWANLLAAAEAVTLEEYEQALEGAQPSQEVLSDEEIIELKWGVIPFAYPAENDDLIEFAHAIIATISAKE